MPAAKKMVRKPRAVQSNAQQPVQASTHHLKSPRFKELERELARITRELEQTRAEERAIAIAECKHLIEMFEFTAYELDLIPTQRIASPKVKPSEKTFSGKKRRMSLVSSPKYQDPATGKTWTGRGPQPKWMTGDRDEYLIGRENPAHGPSLATGTA